MKEDQIKVNLSEYMNLIEKEKSMNKNETKTIKRSTKIICILICSFFILWCLISAIKSYYFRYELKQMKNLNLPDGVVTVHRAKFVISDVYYEKILGEKVIKSSLPYEETIEYIQEHNSSEQLDNLSFIPYGCPWDDYIYNSETDRAFSEEEQKYYVKIQYLKEL